MTVNRADTAVVGGGIVGLAHALAAARRGDRVVLFERDDYAVGASIRNFGMIWSIGQQRGATYERALRSREIWLETAAKTGLWAAETGSLHLAHHPDEVDVLEEFLATTPPARERGVRMITPRETLERSGTTRADGLLAAMWSPTELNVDPRRAIPALASYLVAEYGVDIRFGATVRGINLPTVETTDGDWSVDRAYVCSGNDFETLYPDVFAESGLVRCKLQMMRTGPQPDGWDLGPMLCGGLTLLHYAAFDDCTSKARLAERMGLELPFHRENGIHVLLSQTADGRLTIGDSHAYAKTLDPFEDEAINQAVLDYLDTFAALPDPRITERWVGYYPSLRDGRTELVVEPEPGVTVVNGVGGAGMTLSFGLAEDIIST
ncbi:TIGR03364 family FAD-dependent oxidoreductase [Streptomyces sp. NBC_00841]|uniref:TIGR03364 family FAD-dependent oxidoreductase n=1 Tax=unclassified Streptomyces TaxID=2593676 RepID=UPI002254995E|nr:MULTISPECIES: TIGR03364 family FAD-dependent oxidoreductase [unclassified Streptomyces]MCX4531564.1 TIGR03364 family FAD-dependent oxidoreductase [Streptomyces sp. NBC_01669]WSA02865.1 TIGR03364 family FAD-dependent oxidoreductase [Streptomyces sp. NBC_00841]